VAWWDVHDGTQRHKDGSPANSLHLAAAGAAESTVITRLLGG
jgi:hypothetical protein